MNNIKLLLDIPLEQYCMLEYLSNKKQDKIRFEILKGRIKIKIKRG